MAFNSTVFVFSLALKLYCLLRKRMLCYLQYTVLLFQGYHHLPSHHNCDVVNCREKGRGARKGFFVWCPLLLSEIMTTFL